MSWRGRTLLVCLCLSLAGCRGCEEAEPAAPSPAPAPDEAPPPSVTGRYRAVLSSPGGELPFFMTIGEEGAEPPAVIHNGGEDAPFSSVEVEGDQVRLGIAHYGAEITATRGPDGVLRGMWRRDNRDGESRLRFEATPDEEGTARFTAPIATPGAGTIEDVTGAWSVTFTGQDGETSKARGEFRQEGTVVHGTFLTPTGDYRYLEGDYDQSVLRLACFDGFIAYLFVARANPEGVLTGDFWSRDSYHETFEATRISDDEVVLPDPFEQTRVTSADHTFRFDVTTIDGEHLSMPGDALDGRVVIVDVFGTWCPNCTDETPLLVELNERFHDQGLTVISLAFEYRADPEVALPRLRAYRERHGIDFPMVLAGRAAGDQVAQVLPDLSPLKSYPTTIFIGRDGRVRRIHTGFAGPATGAHHTRLVSEFEALVETLISEPI